MQNHVLKPTMLIGENGEDTHSNDTVKKNKMGT